MMNSSLLTGTIEQKNKSFAAKLFDTLKLWLTKKLREIDWVLIVILCFAFLVRIYGINNPLVDHSSWRQVDTASIARNIYEKNFSLKSIFIPELLYDGPKDNYAQLEFQITPLLIAILYKIIGVRDFYARIVPVLLFISSCLVLYLLVNKYFQKSIARTTCFLYSILPIGIYFSRTVQPESAMLLFGLASIYSFSLWTSKQSKSNYVLALTLGCLSLLAKLPNVFMLLPLLVIAINKFGKKTLKNKHIIAYFIIVFAITFTYFGYLEWFIKHTGPHFDYHNYVKPSKDAGNFVANITDKRLLPNILDSLASPNKFNLLRDNLINFVFTPIGTILFLVGIFIPLAEIKSNQKLGVSKTSHLFIFYGWLLSLVIYSFTIAITIGIEYYLMPLLPIVSIFIAITVNKLAYYKLALPIAMIIIFILIYQSLLAVSPLYSLDTKTYKSGIELQKILRPNEPIIIGTYNPAILYYSGHKGWRTIDLSLDELLFLRSKGAGYYIPIKSARDNKIRNYIKANFKKYQTKSGLIFYDLKVK